MFYSIDNTYTCLSLAEASYLENIISLGKVVLRNFQLYFIVAVSRYFATAYAAYLS